MPQFRHESPCPPVSAGACRGTSRQAIAEADRPAGQACCMRTRQASQLTVHLRRLSFREKDRNSNVQRPTFGKLSRQTEPER